MTNKLFDTMHRNIPLLFRSFRPLTRVKTDFNVILK